MITVLRASGLTIVIYKDDHEPPHVHVLGDGEAKITLLGRTGRPEVVRTKRMRAADVRKSLAIVIQNRDLLLEWWREIHG